MSLYRSVAALQGAAVCSLNICISDYHSVDDYDFIMCIVAAAVAAVAAAQQQQSVLFDGTTCFSVSFWCCSEKCHRCTASYYV